MSYEQRGDYKPLDLHNDGDLLLVASFLMDYVETPNSFGEPLTFTLQEVLNEIVGACVPSETQREIEARLDKLTGVIS